LSAPDWVTPEFLDGFEHFYKAMQGHDDVACGLYDDEWKPGVHSGWIDCNMDSVVQALLAYGWRPPRPLLPSVSLGDVLVVGAGPDAGPPQDGNFWSRAASGNAWYCTVNRPDVLRDADAVHLTHPPVEPEEL
jgi:hypothetical protein